MHDAWITGTANVEYRANTVGWTKAELLSHADAGFQIEACDGSLPHLTLAGASSPLQVNRFVGRLLLRSGKFEIEQGKLQKRTWHLSVERRTASRGQVLDFKLARDGARGFQHHRHGRSASCSHQRNSRDSGHAQTMKACGAFLFAVTVWSLLVPHSLAQTRSVPDPARMASFERKLQHLQSNGAQPHPDPSPMSLRGRRSMRHFASGNGGTPRWSSVGSFSRTDGP